MKFQKFFIPVIIVIAIFAFISLDGFYTVGEQEQAVITMFGNIVRTDTAGLYFKIPFLQQVQIVDITTHGTSIGYETDKTFRNVVKEDESVMITSDFNFVNIDFYLEYKVSDPVAYLYNSEAPESILRNMLLSCIRGTVADYPVDEVITTGKNQIQVSVREKLTEMLRESNIGLQCVNLTVQDAEPPTEKIIQAFKEVETARQARETVINSAKKYRSEQIPKAEAEYAALFKFGKIISVTDNPGIKYKTPGIHTVRYISKKLHLYDIPRSGVITKDKKSMIADNYVTWKVIDPVKYIQTLNAIEARARERIEAAVYNAIKNVISSMTQDEVIEARGGKLSTKIAEDSNSDIGIYGIAIIQTEVKALDLPNDNKSAVYERMISERQNIAASYTAEGNSEAQKIRNSTDREVAIKIAEAKQSADVLIAEGEAQYMKILQSAYDTPEKSEFYNFLRSLDALKKSFTGKGEKIIILDKNSEIGKLIYGFRE